MLEAKVQNIPKELIYEMVGGKPIYYRGYRDYLNQTKKIDEIMGSSLKQSLIITQLIILLSTKLDKKLTLLTNEIGLQFSPNSWRAADLAIVEKARMREQKNTEKYLEFAPEVVVEIDIKASLEDLFDTYGYFHEKTDQLLDFGVKEVIWIFTKTEKIMIAKKDTPWQTFDWNRSFLIMESIDVNIQQLINDQQGT